MASRADFDAAYTVDGARVVETEYRFGGLDGLIATVHKALSGKSGHVQALLEDAEDASRETPLVVYVRNGDAAAREFGAELVDFMCFWESYAFTSDAPAPMFLVLELRSQQR
ncbi:hypothetical protein H8B08_02945 [Caulobacter sp. 17J80-11]|nr:hypothetical protein [Caulobacter sp. 17J80-11]